MVKCEKLLLHADAGPRSNSDGRLMVQDLQLQEHKGRIWSIITKHSRGTCIKLCCVNVFGGIVVIILVWVACPLLSLEEQASCKRANIEIFVNATTQWEAMQYQVK